MKQWSLIGKYLVMNTRLRWFGAISSGGGVGTLHLNEKTAKPSKYGSGFAVLCFFHFQNEKPGPISEEPSPPSVKPSLKT